VAGDTARLLRLWWRFEGEAVTPDCSALTCGWKAVNHRRRLIRSAWCQSSRCRGEESVLGILFWGTPAYAVPA